MRKPWGLRLSAAALLLAGCVAMTSADATLLVNRGLPTANLNNSAGANRSNVAWLFGGTAADYWLVGDTFTNTSSQTWLIDSIRLWTVGATTTAALWGASTARPRLLPCQRAPLSRP